MLRCAFRDDDGHGDETSCYKYLHLHRHWPKIALNEFIKRCQRAHIPFDTISTRCESHPCQQSGSRSACRGVIRAQPTRHSVPFQLSSRMHSYRTRFRWRWNQGQFSSLSSSHQITVRVGRRANFLSIHNQFCHMRRQYLLLILLFVLELKTPFEQIDNLLQFESIRNLITHWTKNIFFFTSFVLVLVKCTQKRTGQ